MAGLSGNSWLAAHSIKKRLQEIRLLCVFFDILMHCGVGNFGTAKFHALLCFTFLGRDGAVISIFRVSQLLKSPIRKTLLASGSHSVNVHFCSDSCLACSKNLHDITCWPNIRISPPLESKSLVSFGKLINTTFILSEPRLQRRQSRA